MYFHPSIFFRATNQVFGQWDEARVPRENPRIHRENVLTVMIALGCGIVVVSGVPGGAKQVSRKSRAESGLLLPASPAARLRSLELAS